MPRFSEKNVSVAGVSPDSLKSHAGFRLKHGLTFPLLSDPGREMMRAYGAIGRKVSYGKESEGVIRSTVVIGPDGRVEAVYPNVKALGHAEAVLRDLPG